MPKAIVVPTAKFAPGKCAVSGDTQGPFIDTGAVIPRYGRIYLSIPHIKLRLAEHKLLDTDEVTELKEGITEQSETIKKLREVEADFEGLISVMSQYVPAKEKVVERKVVVERKPTDEEIEKWIRKFGADHPAVVRSKRVEKGSPEEWDMLYRNQSEDTKTEQAYPGSEQPYDKEDVPYGDAETASEYVVPVPVSQLFNHLGQNIDLDEVLSLNTKEVLEYAEGKGDYFEACLAAREIHLGETEGRNPRKNLLSKLGFWDDESNEPVMPEFEED
jgi:hypothetical protein